MGDIPQVNHHIWWSLASQAFYKPWDLTDPLSKYLGFKAKVNGQQRIDLGVRMKTFTNLIKPLYNNYDSKWFL